jgi:LysR family glycine cleavage system transcriptional activator
LGDGELWARWFKTAGVDARVVPIAIFNDGGLMLQAVEHNLGLALSRELLAVDALADGRLVQLSPLSITDEPAFTCYLVSPPNLRGWPPLATLRQWLHDEFEQLRRRLHLPAETEKKARGKARAK